MAWYAIYRNQQGEVLGFMMADDCGQDDVPAKWDSEEQARADVAGHIMEPFIEFIEL